MRITHTRMSSQNRLTSLLLAALLTLGMGGALAQDDPSQDAEGAGGEQAVIELGEGETITANEFQAEFDRAMRSLAARQGVPYTEQTRALFDRFRTDFLNQLATEEALLREAEERGITAAEQDVQAQIDQARESAGGDPAFQQALQEFGFENEDAYRSAVREGMIAQQVIDEYRSQVDVTDPQVQTFYDENQDLFGGQSLDQVRPQVEQRLVNEQLNGRFEELRSRYGIEVFPERLPSEDAEGLSRGDLEPNEPGGSPDPEGNVGDGAQQDGAGNDGQNDPNADEETDSR